MAQKLGEFRDRLSRSLRDTNKPWTGLLAQAEQKTGVDRLYLFIGGIAVVSLWLVFGYAAQLVCNTVGFIYPAYISIHAIESRSKDDDTKWLTYWVVFALFSVVEYFADFIVGWFPLYWLIKGIFLVWLMIPTEFNGSLVIYKRIIRPYFLKHHSTIDDTLNKVKEQAHKIVDKKE
ncbi:receptor expression-enhancing protein 5 [Cylas formicarius]|uniref:receptor expression-enhancing protein 5 n=1 Tax=Cylas formicarius TaxID=197179 RepID=UPI0029589694|nr:receptor expression-enhancing protein 5 [Cylas formicarius]